MELKAERHLFKFYFTLILYNLLLLLFSSLLFFFGFGSNNKFILGSVFLFAIAISINIGFIKKAPIIILNLNGVFFNNTFFEWSELTDVKLTGKGDMIFTSGECTTLFFNTTRIQLFDDFYSNISEIKAFIQENVIDRKTSSDTSTPLINIDINKELFIPYKGNPLLSFEGFFMWIFTLFFLFFPLFLQKSTNQNVIIFTTSFAILIFLLFSRMLNYFEMSNNFLVIKNHYFFWKNEIYSISDIREIVFERHHKQPNLLRLITKDFNSRTYLAASLNDSSWLEMKSELEKKNISVRNECITEKQ
jgi:hypothetical protein